MAKAGTVEDLIVKLKGLTTFVRVSASNAIDDNKEDILDLNKAQMLVLGVDNEGDQLGIYAPFTVQEREKKGLQTNFIDLRFTGEFQDKMVVEKTDLAKFELTSTDSKWENKLEPQFPDALGLTNENEDKLTKDLITQIDKDVDEYLEPNQQSRVLQEA